MAINTGTLSKLLYPGVNKTWGEAYNAIPEKWKELFEFNTSKRNYEEDLGLSGFGLLSVKTEAGPIAYDNMRQGYTSRYTHIVYGGGFQITREMYEDNLYDIQIKRGATALAMSEKQTREVVGHNVYNRAFNASYVGGDGVTMINTAHPNVAGGTWSNRLATDANLSEAALEQSTIDLMKYTNDRGLRIGATAQKLVLPVDLIYEAERILKSPLRVGTPNNDNNALLAMGKFPGGVIATPYLTSTTAWYILTDVKDGLKYFERRATEFTEDNDFDTENAKYKVTGRYSFGWTDPRGIYGTPGV